MEKKTFLVVQKIKLLFALIALLLFVGVICFTYSAKQEEEYFLSEMATVRDITKVVVATGTIAPTQIVAVGAQVSGQIESIHVKLGQQLRKGTLIARIDSTTQKNELEAQKAQLSTYIARRDASQISLKIAQKKYNRQRKLRREDATSYENLENAEDTLAKARADLTEIESLIRQTQIAVSTAEASLGYTVITAPVDGVVVHIAVDVGQTVNSNQSTPTIVKLADLNTMEVKMKISEGDITEICPGMGVDFNILSSNNIIYNGIIDSIDPVDTTLTDYIDTQINSSEKSAIYYYARMQIHNKNGILRNAMTAICRIKIASVPSSISVPSVAIEEENGDKYVTVLLEKNKIERRNIKTGLSDMTYTQILSGISDGEKVVTARMTDSEIQDNINKYK